MFQRALQKVFVTDHRSLKWSSFFRNRMKHIQHAKYTSNVQCPQKVIPDSIAADFVMAEKLWKQNQNNGLYDFLFQCYEKEKDCFSYTLHLMSQTTFCNKKNSPILAYSIVRALGLWQESNSVSQPLTTQLQTEALMVALSHKYRLLAELVCNVFKINNQCDFLYEVIEDYVALKKFEEAGICILVLKMQERFPVEKVLVPLAFQGKINWVQQYVSENKALQLELVKSLDNVLIPPSSSAQKMSPRTGKLICRRLSNLLTFFKIPPETCPNLCEIQLKGTVNFLFHKRYSEQSISDASWNEMITQVLRDSPSWQSKLILRLTEVKDFATALQMATKFDIPADKWPPVLKTFHENDEMSDFSLQAEVPQRIRGNEDSNKVNNHTETEPLSLHLDSSCLKYIETAEQFEDCLDDISKNYDVVGFDSEWKPNLGNSRNKHCRLSLLQLAVEDSVYLMDILALSACLERSHWDYLSEKIFGNPKILKLGCGLMSDVDILAKNHQGTPGTSLKFSRLLDVAILFQKFQYTCPDILPEGINLNSNLLGLSKICSHVLGSPLKKEEQFSDWEVRPLRDSQLYYAALDAYCLLQIYNKLQEVANEKNLDFSHLLQRSIMLSSEHPRVSSDQRKSTKWSKYDEGFQAHPLISIKEFKVLLDYRLEDLGRKLRLFGVDVVSLADSMSYHEALEMAKAEGRIIVASSWLYEQFKDLGAANICCNISEDIISDESVVAYIFQKFNVKMEAHAISYPDLSDS